MNRPRWQKVLTDMVGNRTRSLLVTASVAVGLFAIGVIVTLYLVIAADMRAAYSQVNPANISLRASLYDEDLLRSLRRLEGVAEVEGVRIIDLRASNAKGDWQAIQLVAYPDPAGLSLNRPRLLEGIWPPARGEIVIEQNKLADLGLSIGQQVQIEQADGSVRSLTLTGVVQDLTLGAYSGGGGFFDSPMTGYVVSDTFADLDISQPDLLSEVYLVAKNGESPVAIQSISARAADLLEMEGVDIGSSATRRTSDHPNAYLVDAIVGVLFILGLLVVFLSGFLITNTLQALLNQQTQQIGIMKTVGARRSQIAGVYVILILGFGFLAFAISAPLAHWVSFTLLQVLARELNFIVQGTRLIWPAVLLQAILAILMPLTAASLPILQGTRISVQEALSGLNSEKSKARRSSPFSTRASAILARYFTRPMLISLRNTFRRRGRLILTLTTLTLGGAIFIATFNVQVSLNKYIDQIGQYFLSDVNVSLDRPYRIDEISTLLADVPGVGSVEGWSAARAELIQKDGAPGEPVQLLAPPADSPLVEPVMISGRWIQPDDEDAIALNELFISRFPHLRVGDKLQLKVYGKETSWTVVGFFRFAGKNGGYSAYTTYETLSRLTGQSYKAASFQIVATPPGLDAAGQDRLAVAVENRLDLAGIRVVDRTTGAYLTEIAGGGFAVLTIFLLFLAALTALVGSIGLTGTMSMNVMERTREIGVMRAIGASDQVLMQMVVVEGMLIGLLSYGLGALLSFPISKVMADGIALSVFDSPAQGGFTPTGFLIWLIVVVVLSFLSSVAPARAAAKLTIREVLAYE